MDKYDYQMETDVQEDASQWIITENRRFGGSQAASVFKEYPKRSVADDMHSFQEETIGDL